MRVKLLFRTARTFGVEKRERVKLLCKRPRKKSVGKWNSLPSVVFENILLFLAQQNVEDVHRCRAVCKAWNDNIKNEFCKPSRRGVIRERLNFNWREGSYPSRHEILQAKKAIRYGILDQTKVEDFVVRIKLAMLGGHTILPQIRLRPTFEDYNSAANLAEAGLIHRIDTLGVWEGYNIGNISRKAVDSLINCVTGNLYVKRISGTPLICQVYGKARCNVLGIGHQILNEHSTRALVETMEARINYLLIRANVLLDIDTLIEYSGLGLCKDIRLGYDAANKYGERLMKWASRCKWLTRLSHQNDNEKFEMRFCRMKVF